MSSSAVAVRVSWATVLRHPSPVIAVSYDHISVLAPWRETVAFFSAEVAAVFLVEFTLHGVSAAAVGLTVVVSIFN
jgi:hypothetical protein